MNIRSELVRAVEPEATWNTTECICGHTVRVPSGLRGWEGTCPNCFRPFVTGGETNKSPTTWWGF